MGVKLLQLVSTPEQQAKVCSWEWDSHPRRTEFPTATLFTAAGHQFIACFMY